MTDSPFWLAIGAFIVSPGFGALAAVLAAFLAYWGIGRQLRGERALAQEKASNDRATALEGDRRRRWWTVLTWLWENRDDLGEVELMKGLIALKSTGLTAEQATMLQVVTEAAALNQTVRPQAVPEEGLMPAERTPDRDSPSDTPGDAARAASKQAGELIMELEAMKGSLPHGL
ncbi:MAG: hypothetical protein ABIZ07_09910 [Dermatophilaceae bacterium]